MQYLHINNKKYVFECLYIVYRINSEYMFIKKINGTNVITDIGIIYIQDATLKNYLSNSSNWSSGICDTTGLTIKGEAGNKHFDGSFVYDCYTTGMWIRSIRIY